MTALGPWSGKLSNGGGRVRLRKASRGIALEANYKDNNRWPAAADGAGHSLILRHLSYGESRKKAWAASYNYGGSPGAFDPVATESLDQIVISEILATNGEGEEDFVEFHHHRRCRFHDIFKGYFKLESHRPRGPAFLYSAT